VRVVIADDSILVREGIATLLRRADIDVAAQASSREELLRAVSEHEPDVAIIDIRMPPTFTDEGLRAAHEIRARHPAMGIVILSQHVETGTATRLLAERPERLGYLLKDRVEDVDEFVGTLRRVSGGGSALDPQIVARLLASAHEDGPLASLSAREHEVLALVAEGRSNKAIGDQLELSQRGVQKHVTAVFTKLGLTPDEDDNRPSSPSWNTSGSIVRGRPPPADTARPLVLIAAPPDACRADRVPAVARDCDLRGVPHSGVQRHAASSHPDPAGAADRVARGCQRP